MQGGCRHAPALQRRLASGGQPAPLAAAHGGGDRAIEPGPAVAAAFAPTGIFTQGAESLAARNGPRHASTRPRAMEATAAAAPNASGARDGALGYSATADELCLAEVFAWLRARAHGCCKPLDIKGFLERLERRKLSDVGEASARSLSEIFTNCTYLNIKVYMLARVCDMV